MMFRLFVGLVIAFRPLTPKHISGGLDFSITRYMFWCNNDRESDSTALSIRTIKLEFDTADKNGCTLGALVV
jgi:hypothetical protein